MGEIRAFFVSILQAFVTGGVSQLAAMMTGPLVSATYHIALGYGWLGACIVVALIIRQLIEDSWDYLAMGVFAVPAILTSLLPLDWAVILMVLSIAVLYYMHEKTGSDWFED